jgi:hypothetical protein
MFRTKKGAATVLAALVRNSRRVLLMEETMRFYYRTQWNKIIRKPEHTATKPHNGPWCPKNSSLE